MSEDLLDTRTVDRWARYLLAAADERRAVDPITDVQPLTAASAYAIQARLLALRVARGERVIGAKLGLTSRAKQRQMKVEEPVYGWLTDAMLLPQEVPVRLSTLIHARAEPEIVFYLGQDVGGPRVTAQDVLSATSSVGGGLEIIDSRYADFRFTLPDVIADNTSAAQLTLGLRRVPPESVDLGLLGCVFQKNGEIEGTATGAALMGHPAESVALLARHLHRSGQTLQKGWVVLAGGLTSAVHLHPGTHITASYAHLGEVRLRAIKEQA